MIPVIVSSGAGVQGLVDYVTHDQSSPSDPRPQTAERVLWTACLGLAIDDPQLMRRVMQGLTSDAEDLKRRAGIRAGGRKLAKPYIHITLAWAPGQNPTKEEMLEAAAGALEAIGIDSRHYGVVAAHGDVAHRHLHIVVCRVDPETGKAVNIGPPAARALSRWAEQYEREHGGIVVPTRVERRECRERQQAAIREQRKEGVRRGAAQDNARAIHPYPKTRPSRRTPPEVQAARRERQGADDEGRAAMKALHDRQRTEQHELAAGRRRDIDQRRREWVAYQKQRAEAKAAGTPVPARPSSPPLATLHARGTEQRREMNRRHRQERASLSRRLTRLVRRAARAVERMLRAAVRRGAPERPAPNSTPSPTARPTCDVKAERRLYSALEARCEPVHHARAAPALTRLDDAARRAEARHRAAQDAEAEARARHAMLQQQTSRAQNAVRAARRGEQEWKPPIRWPQLNYEQERRRWELRGGPAKLAAWSRARSEAEAGIDQARQAETRHAAVVDQAARVAAQRGAEAKTARTRAQRRREWFHRALAERRAGYRARAAPPAPAPVREAPRPAPTPTPTPTPTVQPARVPTPTPGRPARRYDWALDVEPVRRVETPGMSLDEAVRIADEQNRARGLVPPEPEQSGRPPSRRQPASPPPGHDHEDDRPPSPVRRTSPRARDDEAGRRSPSPPTTPAAPPPGQPPSIPDGQFPDNPEQPPAPAQGAAAEQQRRQQQPGHDTGPSR